MESNQDTQVVGGTSYPKATPRKVISILESARKQEHILRLFFGNAETGRDCGEENYVVGYIGRSCGKLKVPLLLEPLRDDRNRIKAADVGDAILCDSIVRIINVTSGEEVYRHSRYRLPDITLGASEHEMFVASAFRDGACLANFKDREEALEYVAFIQGFRIARPFRTISEYTEEMEEYARD